MTTSFRLGGPHAELRRTDSLRGGEVVFQSPRGLLTAQALLIDALPKRPPGRALFGMDTEGAVALAARALWPGTTVEWFHLDAYVGAKVRRVFEHNQVADVAVCVDEDPPGGPFDVAALAFPASGEGLLMRDTLEAVHDRLRMGGRLVASTDRGPLALRRALDKVFGNATPAAATGRTGACFYAERRRANDVRSDHSHVLQSQFAHSDDTGTTDLLVETRSGTFSHGSIDRGTRALIQWLQPGDAASVLDLGAGCGAVGLYADVRLPAARVVLVESNVRAAGCARRNIERNGVSERVEVAVRADLEDIPDSPDGRGYALCLTNPPYFGDFRIAQSFVAAAARSLGRQAHFALVVRAGKAAVAHGEIVQSVFRNLRADLRDGYVVFSAVTR